MAGAVSILTCFPNVLCWNQVGTRLEGGTMGDSKRRVPRKEADSARPENKPGRRAKPATHPLTTETNPASIPRGIEVLVKKGLEAPADDGSGDDLEG